ncbi:MAG: 2-C-methyl-D-erythritol 4-phosphate cytidylyltransferase [Solobacterium sp.]|nr:2-C-methyl-D-erythritol 4-phosphate cytidylyltransferase [Solobacterium sp.]
MNYDVVIVAAGSGTRMGLGYNKVYYRPDQETILEQTMSVFLADPECKHVVVVTEPDLYRNEVHLEDDRICVTPGGDTRQESVNHGLVQVQEEYVLVHDGARPFLSRECLERIKEALKTNDAVCPVIPVKDTIKITEAGYVRETLPRSILAAAQTPQAFRTGLLRECMAQAALDGYTGTDDCQIVEQYSSVKVCVTEGDYTNIKITTPEDLTTLNNK